MKCRSRRKEMCKVLKGNAQGWTDACADCCMCHLGYLTVLSPCPPFQPLSVIQALPCQSNKHSHTGAQHQDPAEASAQSDSHSSQQPSVPHSAEANVGPQQAGHRQLLTRQSAPAGSLAAAAAARAALLPDRFQHRLHVHAAAAHHHTPLGDLPECGQVCWRKYAPAMGLQLHRHCSMLCTSVTRLTPDAEPCTDRASYSLTADTADHLAGRLLHHTTASTDNITQMHGTMLCLVLCYSSACLLDTMSACSDVVQQLACCMVSCVCCQAVAGSVLVRCCIRCQSNNSVVCPDCTTECQQRP